MRTTSRTPPVWVNLIGVSQQIDEDLAEPRRIGVDGFGDRAGELDLQREVLGDGARPHQGSHFAHDAARRADELLDGHLARLDFRDVEDVVDDAQQVVAVLLDGVEELARVRLSPRSCCKSRSE